MLYILGGLPGTGKTTLARGLARERGALHLRIDTIEQAIRDAGVWQDGPAGYMVGYGVAADNLRLGVAVVADSVNPLGITREAWREVAQHAGVAYVEIEVVCSDPDEHRRRVESRGSDIPGHRPPTWAAVCDRQYEPWDRDHIVIDTARRTPEESMVELRQAVER